MCWLPAAKIPLFPWSGSVKEVQLIIPDGHCDIYAVLITKIPHSWQVLMRLCWFFDKKQTQHLEQFKVLGLVFQLMRKLLGQKSAVSCTHTLLVSVYTRLSVLKLAYLN